MVLIDPAAARTSVGTTATSTASAPAPGQTLTQGVPLLLEDVHIANLDLTGALQILIAEVRAALPMPGVLVAESPAAHSWAAIAVPSSLSLSVPQTLVELFLAALPRPEVVEPAIWLAQATQLESVLLAAVDRGVSAVSGWRDVPSEVVDGAVAARELVFTAFIEPPNPMWLRPEWLGLAPRIERFWRRRRRARRALHDPDPHWREFEQE